MSRWPSTSSPRTPTRSASGATPLTKAEKRRSQFFRPELGAELDATDEGFTPNLGNLKDDLDVPAFLRKQMD